MTKQDHHSEEFFMRRALELAALGRGAVSPNPMVGCVIVHNGEIIGEGWHRRYGEAHAEVNAVNIVHDKRLLQQSTVYVTLEPCSHHGKTPPCADLLVREKVARVVISNLDTNPLVAGRGIKKLRDAGVEVVTEVLKAEGSELNKRFFTFIEKQRPYIILKWAETSDGFIARENFDSKWISNEISRQLVHKWRSEEDAVLVGKRTAQHDNPQLNVRDWSGRNPVRIVIDRFLQLRDSLNLFDGSQETICYNVVKQANQKNTALVQLGERDFLNEMLHDMCERKIQSVIVEGGLQTLQLFIDSNLWDEARVFVSSTSFDKGIAAPKLKGRIVTKTNIQSDSLRVLVPDKA
jgi:diaminohydroxyphosphoribosylaminopyrimidine deaminase / 5-amino-6-(5-phosphoribosylamino)uracil reductase